jgi:hypothetical protein
MSWAIGGCHSVSAGRADVAAGRGQARPGLPVVAAVVAVGVSGVKGFP